VIGACGLALLQQGQQFEQGVPGEFCARPCGVVRVSLGCLDRDAKPQAIAIGHDDVTGVLGRMADRHDLEASAVEGMSGVGHLDEFGIELGRVLEGGIMLLSRSIMVVCRRKARPFVLSTKLGLQENGRPSLKGMAPWPGPCSVG
jgi:hypothetical protein